jgi:hypothetical protein
MTNDLVHGLLEVGNEALWIWSHTLIASTLGAQGARRGLRIYPDGGLAGCGIAVRGHAVLLMSERPHPRRSYGRRVYLEDAANNRAVGEHVEVVIVPLAGQARELKARFRIS